VNIPGSVLVCVIERTMRSNIFRSASYVRSVVGWIHGNIDADNRADGPGSTPDSVTSCADRIAQGYKTIRLPMTITPTRPSGPTQFVWTLRFNRLVRCLPVGVEAHNDKLPRSLPTALSGHPSRFSGRPAAPRPLALHWKAAGTKVNCSGAITMTREGPSLVNVSEPELFIDGRFRTASAVEPVIDATTEQRLGAGPEGLAAYQTLKSIFRIGSPAETT